MHHHLGLNVADERSGGNEHSADVTVVLLRGLQSNAEMRSAAGVTMRFTARLGYTADLSGGVQFAWFVMLCNTNFHRAHFVLQANRGVHALARAGHARAAWVDGLPGEHLRA